MSDDQQEDVETTETLKAIFGQKATPPSDPTNSVAHIFNIN